MIGQDFILLHMAGYMLIVLLEVLLIVMVIRNDGSIILDTLIRLECLQIVNINTIFIPPKQFIRQDPYDNQTGEAEFEDRGLYLDEYDLHLEVLEIKNV